jgi:hypothetical protein
MKSLHTLFNMLPHDVIINHIAPYTYQTKPKEHLLDIRSFTCQYTNMVEEYYLTMLNENILLYDLLRYYKKKYGTAKILSIYGKIRPSNPDIDTKIRYLWAKMTPSDRFLFIDDFIFDDDEL